MKIENRLKKVPKIVTYLVCFLVVEALSCLYLDRPVAAFFSLPQVTDQVFVAFLGRYTDLGKGAVYLWPTGVLAILCFFLARGKDVPARFRRLSGYVGTRAIFLFATIAFSGVVTDIIKPIVGRARPMLWLHNGLYGFSPLTFDARWNGMPSGHSTTAFAFAFSLSILYPRLKPIWISYAILIAVSRLAVDAHFCSDVFAGAVVGWAVVKFLTPYSKEISRLLFVSDAFTEEAARS